MKAMIEDSQEIEVRHITIYSGETEFKISVNKFGKLIINKQQYGDGESAIQITPSVSNEIRIS